jgi:hypothetical protein
VLPTPGKYFRPDKEKNSAADEKFRLQIFSTGEIFLSPKLCFAAGISAGLVVITEDPLKKMALNFDKQTRAP